MEAKHFATKRRAFPPAVYNERRINERPLPNTNRDNSDTEDDEQDLSEIVLFGTSLQTRAQSGAQAPGVNFVGVQSEQSAIELATTSQITRMEISLNTDDNQMHTQSFSGAWGGSMNSHDTDTAADLANPAEQHTNKSDITNKQPMETSSKPIEQSIQNTEFTDETEVGTNLLRANMSDNEVVDEVVEPPREQPSEQPEKQPSSAGNSNILSEISLHFSSMKKPHKEHPSLKSSSYQSEVNDEENDLNEHSNESNGSHQNVTTGSNASSNVQQHAITVERVSVIAIAEGSAMEMNREMNMLEEQLVQDETPSKHSHENESSELFTELSTDAPLIYTDGSDESHEVVASHPISISSLGSSVQQPSQQRTTPDTTADEQVSGNTIAEASALAMNMLENRVENAAVTDSEEPSTDSNVLLTDTGIKSEPTLLPVLLPGELPSLLRTPCSRNSQALNDLLGTVIIEEIDEDLTIIIGKNAFSEPFKTTAGNLIKRQNDEVSGNMAFDQTVRKFKILIIPYEIFIHTYGLNVHRKPDVFTY